MFYTSSGDQHLDSFAETVYHFSDSLTVIGFSMTPLLMDSTPKPSWFEQNPKKTLLIIVTLAVVLLDLGMTAVYHFFKFGTIHRAEARNALRVRSPVFHHTLEPNGHHASVQWGHLWHPLYTNSLGFKDRAIRQVPLTSDKNRILFLGDSFTEGVGIVYEKTFVGRIDDASATNNVEVLNASVISYSPAIYFKKTEFLLNTLGLCFDHVVVFLDISDIYDEAESYEISEGRIVFIGEPPSHVKDFFHNYTTLLKKLGRLFLKLKRAITADDASLPQKAGQGRRQKVYRERSSWTVDKIMFAKYGEAGLHKAELHMNFLYDLLSRNRIGLTLAVYPWPVQILHGDLDSIQVRFWREWARKHSVQFINLFPYFIDTSQKPDQVFEKYFIRGDVHWNEEGHKLVGEKFLDAWRKAPPPWLTNKDLERPPQCHGPEKELQLSLQPVS